MPLRHSLLGASWILTALLAPPAAVVAQSLNTGQVRGVVSASGAPVRGALVTLAAPGSEAGTDAATDAGGAFSFELLTSGTYELRVEALGYRPLVARGLTVSPGQSRSLSLELTPAQPPVLVVDTIAVSGAAGTRVHRGGTGLRSTAIDGLPHRFGDLASIVALSTLFDGSLGSQGLPGDMTRTIADGLPVYRAPHPTARTELLPDVLFPTSSLVAVDAVHAPLDVEIGSGAGGHVVVATRPWGGAEGLAAEAAYSGGPMWQSNAVDVPRPSLSSIEGVARGTLTLSPDRSGLSLGADVLRHQTPLAPRISESLAAELSALSPDLLASLSAPSVESYARYAGYARLDLRRSRSSRFFLRAAGSFVERDFDGPSHVSLARDAAPAEQSLDLSLASGFVSRAWSDLTLELLLGVSGSYRDFGAAADAPPSYLTEAGVALGRPPSAAGESSRTDVVFAPILRHPLGTGAIGFGVDARATDHRMAHSRAPAGEYLFSDPASLVSGDGFAVATSTPEASFTTRQVGVLVEYEATPSPGLTISLGARYDNERLGAEQVELNADWLATSGLANDDYPTSLHQLGGRASMRWEPSADGSTLLFAGASLHEGDLDTRALYRLFAEDTGAASSRVAGSGLSWPDADAGAGGAPELPTLTLVGPDTRAPRSLSVEAGIWRRLDDGLSVHVRGTSRRTDFLMRRRNLNLPPVAGSSDLYGRDVLGTLAKSGSLVTATAADARRFDAFGDVWALDPDGWSEYRGVTVGIEHSSGAVELFGSYTFSETRDNWVGAASGLDEAMLDPGLPDDGAWAEGVSDFDVPHRASGGVRIRYGAARLSGAYRFRSGLPFTPRYRYGVDANGDGSVLNDVAFVPGDNQLSTLLGAWPCLERQANRFAERNSCRARARHTVDASLEVGLGRFGGASLRLSIEGLDLTDSRSAIIDDALLLVDPAGTISTSPDGSTVTIPVSVNPGFGTVLRSTARGRLLRVVLGVVR